MKRSDDKLPWNTGKGQIGLHYVPPVRKYAMSRDEEHLQSMLLNKRSGPRVGFIVSYAVLLLMILLMLSLWP